YVVPINMVQDDRMSEELPFGSRGGIAIRHHFPLDGEYLIKISMKKSVYEYVVNIEDPHDLDVRLDGAKVARFRVGGEARGDAAPRPEGPGIGSVTIEGPYNAHSPGETPSRRRLFVCAPTAPSQETGCAKKILSTLTRRAFRRPVSDTDLEPLMAFYREGRAS